MPEVVGVEQDASTAARARTTVADLDHAAVLEAPFSPTTFSPASFDLVTFVAVLHHLPLSQTLKDARTLLKPGGRLVIVGLVREVPADLPWSVTSLLLNPVIGKSVVLYARKPEEGPS